MGTSNREHTARTTSTEARAPPPGTKENLVNGEKKKMTYANAEATRTKNTYLNAECSVVGFQCEWTNRFANPLEWINYLTKRGI